MIKKSITIVHAGDLSDPNGGTNRIIAFANALQIAKIDVQIVTILPKKRFPHELDNIKIYTIPIKEKGIKNQLIRAIWVCYKAKKVIQKHKSTLQIELSTLAGIASFLGCSGYILDVNDISIGDPQYSHLPVSKLINVVIKSVEKRAILNAIKIIVVSKPMKDFIVREWNVYPPNIDVIPNGFFMNKIAEISKKSKNINTSMIVRMGTLFKHFDVDNLFLLAHRLQHHGITICLIGDGCIRNIIETRIKKEGIKNIQITGYLPYEKAMQLTSTAKIVFDLSKRSLTTEVACPIKYLDYAALGMPMVLADCSELANDLKTKKLALVSDPENPSEFIDNILTLLKNDKLREKMADNLKIYVNNYSWEKQGEKLVKLYGY